MSRAAAGRRAAAPVVARLPLAAGRCAGRVESHRVWKRDGSPRTDPHCSRSAAWTVDGAGYCERHAGALVLRLLERRP